MGVKITNNASATLAASITNSATTLTVTTGQGASFPTLTGVDYCWLTLVDTSNNVEVIKCTARSTDSFTIVRAQDNTTARAFAINDRLELRPTAALFDEFANPLSEKGSDIASASPLVITAGSDYFDVTGTTGFAAMTVATNRQFTLQFDGALIMTHHATNLDLPGEANITTVAGDVATFQSTGANTVQCINYTRADGTAVVGASLDGTVTINESGADVNFRVESDAKTHMLFVDGGANAVGIGDEPLKGTLQVFNTASDTIGAVTAQGLSFGSAGHWGLQFLSAVGDGGMVIHGLYGGANHKKIEIGRGHNSANDYIKFYGNDAETLKIMSDGRGLSQFTAKAWARFNGTGTVAIADSHNVSSITDNGTGDYRVNYANSLASANHAAIFQAQIYTQYGSVSDDVDNQNAGFVDMIHREGASPNDSNRVMVVVFGD